jgi:uncharacterized protein (DUF2267 family)
MRQSPLEMRQSPEEHRRRQRLLAAVREALTEAPTERAAAHLVVDALFDTLTPLEAEVVRSGIPATVRRILNEAGTPVLVG